MTNNRNDNNELLRSVQDFSTLKELDSRLLEVDIGVDLEVDLDTYDVYESECDFRASNDPFTPEFLNRLPPCSTTFYGNCIKKETELTNSMVDSSNAYPVLVVYDYELWTFTGENLKEAIDQVESSMLDHLANVLGLVNCNLDAAQGKIIEGATTIIATTKEGETKEHGGGGRTLYGSDDTPQRSLKEQYKGEMTDDQVDEFIAISSNPIDEEDFENTPMGCGIPVNEEIMQQSTCTPISGVLRLYLDNEPKDGDDESTPKWNLDNLIPFKSGILRMIRFGMETDVYVAPSGPVSKVNFIGRRPYEPGTFRIRKGRDGLNNQEGPFASPSGPRRRVTGHAVGIVSAVSAFCLLVLLVLTVVVKRRRRRHEESCTSPQALPGVSKSLSDESDNFGVSYAPWLTNHSRPMAPPSLQLDLAASNPKPHRGLAVSNGVST